MRILQEEAELDEIVRLVGVDALSPEDRVTLEAARSIREDYLQQDAFHEVDTYASYHKQSRLMKIILMFHTLGGTAIAAGARIKELFDMPVRVRIARAKYIPEYQIDAEYDAIERELVDQIDALTAKEGV